MSEQLLRLAARLGRRLLDMCNALEAVCRATARGACEGIPGGCIGLPGLCAEHTLIHTAQLPPSTFDQLFHSMALFSGLEKGENGT